MHVDLFRTQAPPSLESATHSLLSALIVATSPSACECPSKRTRDTAGIMFRPRVQVSILSISLCTRLEPSANVQIRYRSLSIKGYRARSKRHTDDFCKPTRGMISLVSGRPATAPTRPPFTPATGTRKFVHKAIGGNRHRPSRPVLGPVGRIRQGHRSVLDYAAQQVTIDAWRAHAHQGMYSPYYNMRPLPQATCSPTKNTHKNTHLVVVEQAAPSRSSAVPG